MSALDDRLRDVAERLISEYGRTVQLVETTITPADPAKPWGSVGDSVAEVTTSVSAVFLDEGSSDLEARLSAVSRLVLSPVEVSEVKVLVAAKGLASAPTTEMELVDGSRRLAIKKVMTEKPGALPILYTLKVEN